MLMPLFCFFRTSAYGRATLLLIRAKGFRLFGVYSRILSKKKTNPICGSGDGCHDSFLFDTCHKMFGGQDNRNTPNELSLSTSQSLI